MESAGKRKIKKLKYFIIIFILITSLIGYTNSKNETVKTNDLLTDKKIVETDTISSLKVYKYIEYGYQIAYPQTYSADLSGGHSPVANPEFGMRLSLTSKDGQPALDIDSIDKVNYKDKYQNVEGFIKYTKLNVKLEEGITINNEHNKIYKLEGDNYYFSFFENEKYIFQLSSSSKDVLKTVMTTFKFI